MGLIFFAGRLPSCIVTGAAPEAKISGRRLAMLLQ